MHDIVISGGTIIDGTGAPRFTGDVAIDGDAHRRGRRQGRAGAAGDRRRRAAGHAGLGRCPYALRRPGDLGPGAGALLLARRHDHPVRQLRRRLRAGAAASTATLIDLMEAVEDIPGTALAEGLNWEWESFPDYLDALARHAAHDRCRGADPASSAARLCDGRARHRPRGGHRRGHRRDAPPDRGGVRAGAFGFTTSRTYSHKTNAGELVPGHFAEDATSCSASAARSARRRRRFRHEQRFRGRGRRVRVDDPALEGDRPPGLVPADRPCDRPAALAPADGRRAQARAAGAHITAQVAGRPVGIIMGVATSLNPFSIRPSYIPLETLPLPSASHGCATRRCGGDPLGRAVAGAARAPVARSCSTSSGTGTACTSWATRPITSRRTRTASPRSRRARATLPHEVAYDYLTAASTISCSSR